MASFNSFSKDSQKRKKKKSGLKLSVKIKKIEIRKRLSDQFPGLVSEVENQRLFTRF